MKTNNILKLSIVLIAVIFSPLFKQSGSILQAQGPNIWTQKANFSGGARDGAFAFSIGTRGYLGGGNRNGSFKNDVWEYDPTTNVWTQKANVPSNEYLASAFAIGSKAYVACGYNTGNAVYEFDPVANTWTTKAPLPGTGRYITAGFSIGSKGYCGSGYNPNSPYNSYNDFYEFDPIANTWTVKAGIPGGGRSYAVGFNIGSKGYLGTGNIAGNAVRDFYEYDPIGNTWTQKADVGSINRMQSFGIAINGKGYIGGGGQGYDPTGFYEYDATANTWTAKASIPVTRAGAVGFGIGSKLYIGTGGDPFDNDYYGANYYYRSDFYEWNSCGPIVTVSPASTFLCASGSVTLTASGADTYTWSHGGANGSVVNPTATTHYTVTGALTGTCSATNNAVVTVVVSTVAANQTIAPATSSFACNGSANINLTTEAGVNYYLRNDADNTILAGPYTGTGSTLTIPTGNYSTTTTFNINAKRTSGGLTFDGVDDGIRTPGGAFNFAGDFTMEVWAKSPIGANGGTKVIIGQPGGNDLWLGLTNDGFASFTIGGAVHNGTTSINDGKWHHLAAVRTAGTKNLYVDGTLVATGINPSTISANSQLEIGSYGGGYNFKGQLDEVRIYNVALTQPQVANSITNCLTGSEAGLLLYYNFEDGAGSTMVNDIAGSDNNATLVNMNTTTAWSYGVENCIACAATQMTTKPVLTINSITDQTLTPVNPNICVSGTGTITTAGSDSNIEYFLRDNSNNAIVSGPLAGTGSALSFTTGVISSTKTYNVFARSQSAYLDFDGADDVVVTSNTVSIPSGNSPYTMEALIKPDPANPIGTIMAWGDRGTANQSTGLRLNGSAQLLHYWWANDIGVYAGNLADGSWHHVAATYDGATRSVYVDGVLVGSDTPGAHNAVMANGLSIGGAFINGTTQQEMYKGGMDEVRVWNVSRTQSEIAANMNRSLLGNENGLSVYYKFTDGTSSSTTKDYAGGEDSGTLTNMNPATAWQYYSTPCTLQMSNTPTITVHALPTVSAADITICAGNTGTIVPAGAATYTISGGSFTVSPSATDTYSVTGTSSVGCVSSNTAVATVSVNALPTVSASTTNSVICSGELTILNSGGSASTYTWTNGVTDNTAFSPTVTNTYTVTGTDANGCENTATQIVTVNDLPIVTAGATSSVICIGESTTLTGAGAITYTWTNGVIDNSAFSPTVTDTYSVTGTDANGCENTTGQMITVNDLPEITVNSGAICAGQSFTMVPGGAVTYTFSNGSNVATPSADATYSVSGTDANGCVSSTEAVASVTVNALPTVTVSSGVICAGQSFTMVPGGAVTYTFSNGSNVATPSTDATYSVSGTDANGCVSSTEAVASVTVNALPTVTVSSGAICAGQSFTMVPGGAVSYTFSNGSNVATPSTDATYSVSGTDANGCISDIDAISSVTVHVLPTIMATTNNTLLCTGETATLSVTGSATSYTWSSTETTTDIAVSPTTTTTYTVEGTDANGCANTTAITQDVSLCTGIATLSAIEAIINVYPNPNNGVFYIELTTDSKVSVMNALGQTILNETMITGKHELDILNQADGIYFVKVTQSNKQQVIKFIKK